MNWTILPLLNWTKEYFTRHELPNPRGEAERILAHVLGKSRTQLYVHFEQPVAEAELARLKGLIQRRVAREPLQYILGVQEFFGLAMQVGPEVLIPRPETEQLVEQAVAMLRALSQERPTPARVLEIGTGSGCISIALAKELPQAEIVATDVSEAALEVAAQNMMAHQVMTIQLMPCHLFPALNGVGGVGPGAFDLILSNPPYIPSGQVDGLAPEVSRFEPRLALDGGEDGGNFYRFILAGARPYLKPDGRVMVEIGDGQLPMLREIAAHHQWDVIEVHRDYQQKDRVVVVRALPEMAQESEPESEQEAHG